MDHFLLVLAKHIFLEVSIDLHEVGDAFEVKPIFFGLHCVGRHVVNVYFVFEDLRYGERKGEEGIVGIADD